ncbi:SDR family oxidoreductase [Rhizobium sp. Root1220]|uniref:SDR family oxidoreductase n=1 Tax=Rhizobium sp. Root1220 TaxID=1736432 RepID=UPI0006F91F6A|nr:SDR family oxidoreductase [Rhizobium sp. Root1220]KQV73265.1 NmrA family transcriptional regulator [Rhizobium sp. Root1220]
MKIVIIGGSGLIGTKVANILRSRGHDVNQASPSTGVNALTGEGLADVLAGADVVLDVANSPSFEPAAVLSFFETATANLLEAEAKAGVGHHVALSIVGLERSPDNGYFPGKLAQEARVKNGGVPYTIVRSTQFLEFIGGIADSMAVDGTVHASPGAFQPISADDVAAFVADAVCADPINGTLEIAGPEKGPMSDFLKRFLEAKGDDRKIVVDRASKYFGSLVDEESLVPLGPAKLGKVDFATWFAKSTVRAA